MVRDVLRSVGLPPLVFGFVGFVIGIDKVAGVVDPPRLGRDASRRLDFNCQWNHEQCYLDGRCDPRENAVEGDPP